VSSPAARAIAACAACAASAVCAACDRAPRITSCDDDLRGVYVAGTQRWMILDNGAALEAYPLFPDGAVTRELVTAPRVIDLERAAAAPAAPDEARPSMGSTIRGTLHQRFMQGAARCDAHVPVHVTRCDSETLELVMSDPSPPIGFTPCEWPRPGASRVVRLRRE
jgi:hypothetical protein